MRIISGRCKGLKLAAPPGKSQSIRPTSDRSREALFSIIGNRVKGSRVLDLFAGTGALGIEALSRGGASTFFVDNSPTALKLIKKNITLIVNNTNKNLDIPITRVIRCDLTKGLQPLLKGLEYQKHIFDIIFLDPPYDKGLSLLTLKNLDNSNLLADDGVIIAEDRSNAVLPITFQKLELTDKRKYGDTGFWLYERSVGEADLMAS